MTKGRERRTGPRIVRSHVAALSNSETQKRPAERIELTRSFRNKATSRERRKGGKGRGGGSHGAPNDTAAKTHNVHSMHSSRKEDKGTTFAGRCRQQTTTLENGKRLNGVVHLKMKKQRALNSDEVSFQVPRSRGRLSSIMRRSAASTERGRNT